jgi:cyclohexa-1,5-dienecarbonyl-CoA hydratase
MTAPLAVWLERDGALLRLRLARPKANVLDAAMISALETALDGHGVRADLKGVLLDASGPHFSFGASVEEHLPAHCATMLQGFNRLILRVAASPVPVLVAIKGQCLGGGLELASAGHVLVAAPDARLGQPEIQLGVFAPAASCLLPLRLPRCHAEDLLLSGRAIGPEEGVRLGLVNAIADDPEAAALAWFDAHLAPKSACALRHAVRAAREGFVAELRRKLAVLERAYLEDLMRSHDAVEGLEAFLAKRPALWENR